ncbi:S1/P1 nuclease [Muricauda sp. SCSIO 64092]|uniref:S1/P1 nuclease n=1 Tax=Allomuricauda sp. SCSIO 64092 TaxID=2908842 RepID=UPI001FF2FA47|nr:S1/P1 nuclease [Muricauda sp. SCSIO 64092]UOY07374.1 S1/P1 nuclease [Muricauda sp. SCSIO 64092]
MRNIVLIAFLLPLLSFGSLVWGPKGHRVTGYIAEKHLTRKAKKALDNLLEGHSLAFVSTYADEIKSDTKYAGYTPWHYVNYPLDMTYKDSEKSAAGDIVTGIAKCKMVLRDGNGSRADKIFHLKLLVHFLGDLHQPLHVGRAVDRGGNDIPLQWFNERSNLHKLWDTNLLETYGMGFYELGDELDRSTPKKERKQMQEGTIESWLEESHVLAKQIYASANAEEKLGYSYAYEYNPMVFEQLKKGGFRLAKVLNEVFS